MSNIRGEGPFEGISQGTLDWINNMFRSHQGRQDQPLDSFDDNQKGEDELLTRSPHSISAPISIAMVREEADSQYDDTLPRRHYPAEGDFHGSALHNSQLTEHRNVGQRSASRQDLGAFSMDTLHQPIRTSPALNIPSSTHPPTSAACSTSLAHSALYRTDDLPQPFDGSANNIDLSASSSQNLGTQIIDESFLQPQYLENMMENPQLFSTEMNISSTFLGSPQIPIAEDSLMPINPSQTFVEPQTIDYIPAQSYSDLEHMGPPKRRRTLPSEQARALQPHPQPYHTYPSAGDPATGPPSLIHNSSSSLSSSMTPKTPASPTSSQPQPQSQIRSQQHITKPAPLSIPEDHLRVFPSVETPISPERARDLERNRLAAKKSRNKKRDYTEDLAVRSRDYGAQNMVMKERVKGLQEEVQSLRTEIRKHRGCGGWDEEMERSIESYLQKVDSQESEAMMKQEGDDDDIVVIKEEEERELLVDGELTTGIVKMDDEDL